MPMEISSPSDTSQAHTAALPHGLLHAATLPAPARPGGSRHPDMHAGRRACTAAGVRDIRTGDERQGIATVASSPAGGPHDRTRHGGRDRCRNRKAEAFGMA
ncbi:hypothetical protein GCM10010305_60000 [Streptomyces termitum]|uniref:Uncharacterized protein n=1 Tax=Streptomyces termitum TaxID=67368 RepID=A0A918T7Y6_9ACTN|nr:hypothetical protein GCM10010305_60000 [Streptomyces termitum]